ncbi:hypothetical protein OG417_39645 [Actinoallomurus sp. NBC_01490]|jgi:hypothetical protein|uniref:hypothetical protein n=1 Tax=Actinoallomurus sp. NBC_01490 TaxID=2903557 RepID=UPI002E30233A|nr:hypothetical protein [Actinoallomurus sp. NBC_01490]
MSKHVLLVFTNPQPGREEEFNSWYDEVHLPDVLGIPGYQAAQRFVAKTGLHDEKPEHRYLTIYEIDEEDLPTALSNLREGLAHAESSDAMAPALITYGFTAVADRVEAGDTRSVPDRNR